MVADIIIKENWRRKYHNEDYKKDTESRTKICLCENYRIPTDFYVQVIQETRKYKENHWNIDGILSLTKKELNACIEIAKRDKKQNKKQLRKKNNNKRINMQYFKRETQNSFWTYELSFFKKTLKEKEEIVLDEMKWDTIENGWCEKAKCCDAYCNKNGCRNYIPRNNKNKICKHLRKRFTKTGRKFKLDENGLQETNKC